MGIEPDILVLIAGALLLGAVVQSVVGLGLGLVAAPVITLAEPGLMPGTMIALAMVLPCFTLVRDHHHIDWYGLAWSLPTRVVGTIGGVWMVVHFSHRQLGIVIGLVVLLAVLVTWRVVAVPVNRGTLGVAGLVSGVTGTATSIGGPPFALLYQHRAPQQIRTTMAVYFVFGAAMSMVGLAVGGDLTGHQVRTAGVLVPVMLMGVLVGSALRPRLPLHLVRPAVLALSAASAVVVLVRSLVG